MQSDRAARAGRPGGAVRAVLLAGMLLASSGCAERYLQNAQDSFSKGAAIENQAVLGDSAGAADRTVPGPPPAPMTGGAVIYYADARDNVRKALAKERAALDKQELTGSALALQALVNWRLDDLQGSRDGGEGDGCDTLNYRRCADASSRMAKDLLDKTQPFLKRDRFMMAILPGLLAHNLGLRHTAQTPKDAGGDFASAFRSIDEGFVVIEPVRPITGKPLTTEQALKVYALLAQYQVLRAWSAAMTEAARPDILPAQALTVAQRDSCKFILRDKWASRVTGNLDAVDPGGLAVPGSLRNSFLNAIANPSPVTQPPCPWSL